MRPAYNPSKYPISSKPEVAPPGGETRAADLVGVEALTQRLDFAVEVRFGENLIQSPVTTGARQIFVSQPTSRLLRTTPSFAHRHARQCRGGSIMSIPNSAFCHGLLAHEGVLCFPQLADERKSARHEQDQRSGFRHAVERDVVDAAVLCGPKHNARKV
jgi:hypothetical protein